MKGQKEFIVAMFILFIAVNLEGVVDLPTELAIGLVGMSIGVLGIMKSPERK